MKNFTKYVKLNNQCVTLAELIEGEIDYITRNRLIQQLEELQDIAKEYQTLTIKEWEEQ